MSRGGLNAATARPALTTTVILAARTFYWFAVVVVLLRRRPLADLVERLGTVRRRRRRVNAGVLGRGVAKLLHVGPIRARCLTMALVHYRLLREQGDPAELVIGLEGNPQSIDAHAWVEIGGIDVGPPPGRGSHRELVRYG
jgi:hypothetical protein